MPFGMVVCLASDFDVIAENREEEILYKFMRKVIQLLREIRDNTGGA